MYDRNSSYSNIQKLYKMLFLGFGANTFKTSPLTPESYVLKIRTSELDGPTHPKLFNGIGIIGILKKVKVKVVKSSIEFFF